MEKPLQLIEVDRSPSPVPDPSRLTRSLLAGLFGPSLTASFGERAPVLRVSKTLKSQVAIVFVFLIVAPADDQCRQLVPKQYVACGDTVAFSGYLGADTSQ